MSAAEPTPTKIDVEDKKFVTLDDLGDKLRTMAEKNQDMLDEIHTRLHTRVISGYTYHIDSKLSKVKDPNAPTYTMTATPVRNLVASCLEAWEYTGEPLEEVFDVFNDKTDFRMKIVSDVLRLNKDLCNLGCKYADLLSDRPRSRAGLKKIIGNMEKVVSAVEDLDRISSDATDGISEEIQDEMAEISAVFDKMSSKLSKINMSVSVTEYVGYAGILEDVVKIDDPDAISKKATLSGHGNSVSKVAFYEINDKPCLASAGRDNTIRIWDLTDNSEIATLEGHESVVSCLAKFELDGKPCLASGSFDHSIKLWDMTTNSLIGTLSGHTHYVYALASYQMDGVPYLASGSVDSTIKLWNLESLSLETTIPSKAKTVFALAAYVHDDVPYLASGGNDDNITLWDLEKKEAVRTLTGHSDYIRCIVSYRNNGIVHVASSSYDGTIKLWNVNDGSVIASFEDVGSDIAITPFTYNNLPALASGNETGALKFYSLTDNELVKTLENASGSVLTLSVFNLANKPAMAIGTGHEIEVWE
jgi:WD40 repeat protein